MGRVVGMTDESQLLADVDERIAQRKQADALFVPGDIPGLLRRCSPVRVHGPPRRPGYGDAPATGGWHYPAVVLWCGDERAEVHSSVHGWACGRFDRTRLELDLSTPTGRAHAAWWLLKLKHPPAPDGAARWVVGGYETHWSLHEGEAGHWRDCSWPVSLDWLADLEEQAAGDLGFGPFLEDGSRWVDAEALRRVVLHEAGRL